MTEEFDIFDANMVPAHPYRASRDTAHRDGLWHQTFHCWILRKDENGTPFVFLQQRGPGRIFPHSLDVSAAGHLQAGETPDDGIREVEEELGLAIDPSGLTPLGIYKQATDDHDAIYYNREFCHSFFYETDKTPLDCSPQESEVNGVFEIKLSDAIHLFSGAADTAHIAGIAKKDGETGYHPHHRQLTRQDMWGYHDRCVLSKYYLRIFQLAELYFKGIRPLFI